MSPNIRIGIVGLGHGLRVLLPAFRADPRCMVTAIAGTDPKRAEASAQGTGVAHVFSDGLALARAGGIDAVAIAVPPAIQSEIARVAVASGKAIFAEKPLATDLAHAHAVAAAAEKAGVANMVNFMFPEIPVWQKAKELLADGAIGRPASVELTWNVEVAANRDRWDSWKTRAADGGGTLGNFGSHSFHYLEWLLGPIQRLSAGLFRAPDDQRSGETLVHLGVEFASGLAGTARIDTAAPFSSGHRLAIYGRDGTLALENLGSDYAAGFRLWHGCRPGDRFQEIMAPETLGKAGEDGRIAPTRRIAARFLDWIETGCRATPDAASGVRVQELIEAARTSARTGTWVATGSR